MTTFADQFQSTNGAPIRYDGRELHAKLAFQVKNGDTIELRFLRSAERPVQVIGITCEKCEIRVASTTAKRIGLWADVSSAYSGSHPSKWWSCPYVSWRTRMHWSSMSRRAC